jgi:nucleoside-diphosphate-sugar epimerase
MRLLITGATGFIGRAVARVALARGHEVAGLVREGSLEPAKGRVIRGDLQGGWDREALRDFRPEICLHAAWLATPGVYLTSPHNQYYAERSLDFLLELIKDGVKGIVAVGSCIEYAAGSRTSAISAQEPPEPKSPYAKAKHLLHLTLRQETKQYNVPLTWVRVFFPYGVGEHPQRLVSLFAGKFKLGQRVRLKTPESIKDFIAVEDVAEGLVIAAEKQWDGTANLGSGEGQTIETLARQVAGYFSRPELVECEEPRSVDEHPQLVADLQEWKNLGWQPKINFVEGVTSMLQCSFPRDGKNFN